MNDIIVIITSIWLFFAIISLIIYTKNFSKKIKNSINFHSGIHYMKFYGFKETAIIKNASAKKFISKGEIMDYFKP